MQKLHSRLDGYVCRGRQMEIERIHPPPISCKNRLKSFCEVGYTISGLIFCCWQEDINGAFGRGGATYMMPSSIKKICSFSKKRKCARKIFIVFVTLSNLSMTSNRAVTHASYKIHENWCVLLWVIYTCGQCDSTYCALQLTPLTKPIVVFYYISVLVCTQVRY